VRRAVTRATPVRSHSPKKAVGRTAARSLRAVRNPMEERSRMQGKVSPMQG
jgi:hypothetical protein